MHANVRRALIVVSLSAALAGCHHKVDTTVEEGSATATATAQAAAPQGGAPMTPESTIVEENDNGTITWSVVPEGRVEAVVKGKDGTPITKDITGVITWPGEIADDFEDVKLDANGHIVAAGPPLEADLTEIDYDLVVAGKTWSGVLHVPRGGTRAIEADAQASAEVAREIPAGKKGPNGGVIQVIGKDRVEIVADKETGEVRVYVLGPALEPIDPGERRIRLGYVAEDADTVELVREPGQVYYVGRWGARVDPVRVTCSIGIGADVHVGIVGFSYGMSLGYGVRAYAAPIVFERHWAPSVVLSARVGWGYRYGYAYGSYGYGYGYGRRYGYAYGGRERVEVGGRVRVDERMRGREHVEVGHGRGHDVDRGRGHFDNGRHGGEGHGRGGHFDNGRRDHGEGHGRPDHGGGRGGPSRGGGRGGKHR